MQMLPLHTVIGNMRLLSYRHHVFSTIILPFESTGHYLLNAQKLTWKTYNYA